MCSITHFTDFLITGTRILDCFFGPEGVNDRGNKGIDDGFQEPLVDPQQDRNHNAGNAHHDYGSDGQTT